MRLFLIFDLFFAYFSGLQTMLLHSGDADNF